MGQGPGGAATEESPPRPQGRGERRGLPRNHKLPRLHFGVGEVNSPKFEMWDTAHRGRRQPGGGTQSGAEVGSRSGGAHSCTPTAPDWSGRRSNLPPPRGRPQGAWAAPLGKWLRRPGLVGHLLLRVMSDSRFSLRRSSLARSAPVPLPSPSLGVAAAQFLRTRRARALLPEYKGAPGPESLLSYQDVGPKTAVLLWEGSPEDRRPPAAGQRSRAAFPVLPENLGAHGWPETPHRTSGRARNGTRDPRAPARAFANK